MDVVGWFVSVGRCPYYRTLCSWRVVVPRDELVAAKRCGVSGGQRRTRDGCGGADDKRVGGGGSVVVTGVFCAVRCHLRRTVLSQYHY